MQKSIIAGLFVLPVLAHASAMAISLGRLFVYNNTNAPVKLKIANLNESNNQFTLAAHSSCQLAGPVMFTPADQESNNFVIPMSVNEQINPIVIDQFGLITLASDAVVKMTYSSSTKQYSLLGFCDNRLSQYKFLNVKPSGGESAPPQFILNNCKQTSNFVYFVNDKYIKVKNRLKKIDFSQVKSCVAAVQEPQP
jgi:hypothetical protein